jgi:hypothetical protein
MMRTSHHHAAAAARPVCCSSLRGRSLGLGLALLLMAPGASADPVRHFHPDPPPPRVSVDFLVAGRPLPREPSRHGGTFVVVPRWGVEYEIRLRNNESRDRVLFVIGVDGLSVMDGSHVSRNSGGYVLEPGETARIRGWRRGHDRVAAFTFTRSEDSYAARTGHRSKVGEITIWAVREEGHCRPPVVTPKTRAAERKRSEACDRALHSERSTGTGYGDELVDHVRSTPTGGKSLSDQPSSLSACGNCPLDWTLQGVPNGAIVAPSHGFRRHPRLVHLPRPSSGPTGRRCRRRRLREAG